METTLARLASGAKGSPVTTGGYSLNCIISGDREFNINNGVVVPDEGGTLYFDARRSHTTMNSTGKKATIHSINLRFQNNDHP